MDVVHASVITDLFAFWTCSFCLFWIPSSSDMDARMRSLGGRTMPDGAVGILPAIMMVIFLLATNMWTSVEPMLTC